MRVGYKIIFYRSYFSIFIETLWKAKSECPKAGAPAHIAAKGSLVSRGSMKQVGGNEL